MKKMIIMILAVLPIFLLIFISFAGKIISEVTHVPVESIVFVDDLNNKYSENKIIEINKGETYSLKAKIYPELASNKNVKYTSGDTDICTVDEYGVVYAVGNKLSSTVITVKTEEGAKTASIFINVTNKKVSSVSIVDKNHNSIDEITLSVGDSKTLYASIEPFTAENKRVIWSSSDDSIVYVNQYTGSILAKEQGTVTITVATIDGNYTDNCIVHVDGGKVKLAFDFSNTDDIYAYNSVYKSKITEIKLINYIVYDETIISISQIKFRVNSGSAIFNEETGILTINGTDIISITAYIDNDSGISVNIKIVLEG